MMSDKKLKLWTRIALVFFLMSVVFCVSATIYTQNRRIPHENDSYSVQNTEAVMNETVSQRKKIIVIDAGHGKPSSQMSDEEKEAEGFTKTSNGWGEWRHYKNGTFGEECEKTDCNGYKCWYPIYNGDRSIEPELNLNNAFAVRDCLEQMGYEVRLTRETNDENPSINKRVSYCFADNDITAEPEADAFICLHSNAGGGRGTSYIQLSGEYNQKYIKEDYISSSNMLGEIINKKIADSSELSENPPIDKPYLILFNKCPVPIAYLEIGFYDDAEELEILEASSDIIGRAIAEGIDEYFQGM